MIRPAEMAAKLTSHAATHGHRTGDMRAKRNKRQVTEMEQSAAAKEAHRYRRFQRTIKARDPYRLASGVVYVELY